MRLITDKTAKLLYVSPAQDSDIFWATKFEAPDPFIFVEYRGKKYIIVNSLEYGRAKKEAEVDEVLLDSDVWKNNRTRTISRVIAEFLKGLGSRTIEIPENFPAVLYQKLKNKKFRFRFKEPPFFPKRLIKTKEEIEDIKLAQKALEKAFKAVKKVLAAAKIKNSKVRRSGKIITSEFLKDVFESELNRWGYVSSGTIFASGEQAVDPHHEGSGPLIPNTLIVCDMFARTKKGHHWSDMTRMLVKGKATAEMKKMFRAVRLAQKQAEEMVKPGVDGYDIHQRAVKTFEKLGWKTGKINGGLQGFIHGTGHGIGLDIHELPRLGLVKNQILRAGNVITIEPGLYYPGLGGCRLEDTVVVKEKGFENLAKNVSKELIEIP